MASLTHTRGSDPFDEVRDDSSGWSVDSELASEMRRRQKDAVLQERLALADDYGADLYEDRTVLVFEKNHKPTPGVRRNYTYAALKANGRWWLTGPSQAMLGGHTWFDLITFLIQDNPVRKEDVKVLS